MKRQPDYSKYFAEKEKMKNKSERRGVKIKRKTDEKWKSYIELVINSDIDFSKHGWVGHVAELLGIKSQNVNKWMKRYLPDFYENECFKRKKINKKKKTPIKQ